MKRTPNGNRTTETIQSVILVMVVGAFIATVGANLIEYHRITGSLFDLSVAVLCFVIAGVFGIGIAAYLLLLILPGKNV